MNFCGVTGKYCDCSPRCDQDTEPRDVDCVTCGLPVEPERRGHLRCDPCQRAHDERMAQAGD